MSAYMGDAVLLYLQELIDWESYFSWREGRGERPRGGSRGAMREVLETAAAICEEQEPALRAGWYENVELVERPGRLPEAHQGDRSTS